MERMEMTVDELIKLLGAFPQELRVEVCDENEGTQWQLRASDVNVEDQYEWIGRYEDNNIRRVKTGRKIVVIS